MTMDGTECAVAAFLLLVHRLAVLALVLSAGCWLGVGAKLPRTEGAGMGGGVVGSRLWWQARA